jgi:hypothetical protein
MSQQAKRELVKQYLVAEKEEEPMITFKTFAELVAFCKKQDEKLNRVRFEMADGEPVVAFHTEQKADGTIVVIVSDLEN